jgi:CBS domain-containing protein
LNNCVIDECVNNSDYNDNVGINNKNASLSISKNIHRNKKSSINDNKKSINLNNNIPLAEVVRSVDIETIKILLKQKLIIKEIKNISPMINWDLFESTYPQYPSIKTMKSLTDNDKLCLIDLKPYMDCSPYKISEFTTISRTYKMFRTLGLRHLCVIDKWNRIIGIVTRANLVQHKLTEKCKIQTDIEELKLQEQNKYFRPPIELDNDI